MEDTRPNKTAQLIGNCDIDTSIQYGSGIGESLPLPSYIPQLSIKPLSSTSNSVAEKRRNDKLDVYEEFIKYNFEELQKAVVKVFDHIVKSAGEKNENNRIHLFQINPYFIGSIFNDQSPLKPSKVYKKIFTKIDEDAQVENISNEGKYTVYDVHNCTCCKDFFKDYGTLCVIKDGKIISALWDVETYKEIEVWDCLHDVHKKFVTYVNALIKTSVDYSSYSRDWCYTVLQHTLSAEENSRLIENFSFIDDITDDFEGSQSTEVVNFKFAAFQQIFKLFMPNRFPFGQNEIFGRASNIDYDNNITFKHFFIHSSALNNLYPPPTINLQTYWIDRILEYFHRNRAIDSINEYGIENVIKTMDEIISNFSEGTKIVDAWKTYKGWMKENFGKINIINGNDNIRKNNHVISNLLFIIENIANVIYIRNGALGAILKQAIGILSGHVKMNDAVNLAMEVYDPLKYQRTQRQANIEALKNARDFFEKSIPGGIQAFNRRLLSLNEVPKYWEKKKNSDKEARNVFDKLIKTIEEKEEFEYNTEDSAENITIDQFAELMFSGEIIEMKIKCSSRIMPAIYTTSPEDAAIIHRTNDRKNRVFLCDVVNEKAKGINFNDIGIYKCNNNDYYDVEAIMPDLMDSKFIDIDNSLVGKDDYVKHNIDDTNAGGLSLAELVFVMEIKSPEKLKIQVDILPEQLSAEYHQHKRAIDTVRNGVVINTAVEKPFAGLAVSRSLPAFQFIIKLTKADEKYGKSHKYYHVHVSK